MGTLCSRQVSLSSSPSSGATSIAQDESYSHSTTIDILPDNVFLDIFDFYRTRLDPFLTACKWLLLVHVCRRWRQIIFGSSRRLDLQILWTYRRPSKKTLAMWPDLPIAVYCSSPLQLSRPFHDDDVMPALEHPDRICYFRFTHHIPEQLLKKMVTAMQKPFPVLRCLIISSFIDNAPFLPDNFLGGSAPSLQAISICGISFPGLPTLLSSTRDLVGLYLYNVPPAGYISPAVMAVCLGELPKLKTLVMLFKSAIFRLDRIHLPPIIRIVLPALTDFQFTGASKYLEALVERFEGPQLNNIMISLMDPVADIQVVQLSKFFDRSAFRHTKVCIHSISVTFDMHLPTNYSGSDWPPARTTISCGESDWQISRISRVVSNFSAILSTVVHLSLVANFCSSPSRPLNDEDGHEWLHFFHQFPTMQALYVSRQFAVRIACALKSVPGEVVAEALPSLDLIFLEDQPASSVEQFVAVRQLSGRPVTVVDTEDEFDRRLIVGR